MIYVLILIVVAVFVAHRATTRIARPVSLAPVAKPQRVNEDMPATHSDPEELVHAECRRAESLLARGEVALKTQDDALAVSLVADAFAAAWSATYITIRSWEAAVDNPPRDVDGDMLELLMTSPLEFLVCKEADDDPGPPLMSMLLSAFVMRNAFATLTKVEPVSLSIPSAESLNSLVRAELALRTGKDAIDYQLRTVRTALQGVGESFHAFLRAAEGKDVNSIFKAADHALGRIRSATASVMAGVRVLRWPLAY